MPFKFLLDLLGLYRTSSDADPEDRLIILNVLRRRHRPVLSGYDLDKPAVYGYPWVTPEHWGQQGCLGQAMAAVKLEDLLIKSLKKRAAVEGQRRELRDTIVRGLAIRATHSGALTWTFMFRLKGSRRLRRITLGNYSHMGLGQARAAAKDILSEVRLGGDPHARIRERAEAEHQPKLQTFSDLYHLWLDRYAKPNLRAWRAEGRALSTQPREVRRMPAYG
jgi:Arm DNA-binding domain